MPSAVVANVRNVQSGHAVDTLVDVLGGLEGGRTSMIARAGLDRRDREKRNINEMRGILSACHVSITCTREYGPVVNNLISLWNKKCTFEVEGYK